MEAIFYCAVTTEMLQYLRPYRLFKIVPGFKNTGQKRATFWDSEVITSWSIGSLIQLTVFDCSLFFLCVNNQKQVSEPGHWLSADLWSWIFYWCNANCLPQEYMMVFFQGAKPLSTKTLMHVSPAPSPFWKPSGPWIWALWGVWLVKRHCMQVTENRDG